MSVLAALKVVLGLDTGPFQKGATQAQMEAQKLVKSVESTGRKMTTVGLGMSAAITAPFVMLVKSAVPAATESAQALAQVNAALASMGPVAGRTTQQLQDQAAALMHISTFDDDDILKSVTANMLTFGKITGETFDRAQLAAINLSARLGQDLQSSTIQIGKALNDPIKGVTALQRVGVSFTAQQREQIKAMTESGNVAGAQKIILGELEKQFGGAAKAMHDATPGADVQHSWDDFKEKVGAIALKVAPPLLEALGKILDMFNSLPDGVQTGIVVFAGVAAVIGPVVATIGTLVTTFAGMAPVVAAAGAALSPILVPLAAVAAAAAAVWYAWKHWDDIKAIVGKVAGAVGDWWNVHVGPVLGKAWDMVKRGAQIWWDMHVAALQAVAKLYQGVKDWLGDKLGAIWQWVVDKIKWVKDEFFGLYDAVVGHSYIPDMVDGIAQHMARLDTAMVKPAQSAAEKTKAVFAEMTERVQEMLDRLFPEARALLDYRKDLETIDWAEKSGKIDPAQAEEARRRAAGIPDKTDPTAAYDIDYTERAAERVRAALEKVTTAANDNSEKVKVANVRIVKSFKEMAEETTAALRGLVDSIKGGDFLSILDSVVKLVIQLGSIGLFGKKVQANINAPAKVPGYAGGTRWHPGGLAMVGEAGPELVNLPRGSQVFPNGSGFGGMTRVVIEASPYFDARVQKNIGAAAPGIVKAGAAMGERRTLVRQARSLG